MNRVATLGRVLVGLGVLGSGLQQLATGTFVRIAPKVPAFLSHPALPRLLGVLLVAIGLAIVANRFLKFAAPALAAVLLVLFAAVQVPLALADPMKGFLWTNPWKVLAMIGGALLLWPACNRLAPRIAPFLLGGFLLICGVQHFIYAPFVTQLVPEYMPARSFWTYFTGTALALGGIGVAVPRARRLAALCAGAMILAWVFMLHIPRALHVPRDPGELSGAFEATLLSGIAFLVASRVRSRAV
jgi:uncharacterized membrane protein YphA (DoxX/SURF4 family)